MTSYSLSGLKRGKAIYLKKEFPYRHRLYFLALIQTKSLMTLVYIYSADSEGPFPQSGISSIPAAAGQRQYITFL